MSVSKAARVSCSAHLETDRQAILFGEAEAGFGPI